jgi:hypothetical protein
MTSYCKFCRRDWCECGELYAESLLMDAQDRQYWMADDEPTGTYVWHGDRLQAAQDREQALNAQGRHGDDA